MRTLGIDLAAQAKGTFFCELGWDGGAASIAHVRENQAHAADDDLREHIAREGLAIVGVDVPFGWPDDFVALMAGVARCAPGKSVARRAYAYGRPTSRAASLHCR